MSAGNDLVDSTKTHPGDTSPKSHVSIETFARDLHDALEIRDVKSHIYDRVSVLVLCWEDAKSEKGLGLRTSINKATEAMSAMGWKIHEHEIPLARNARNVLEGIFYGWMQECASMAAKDDSINILQILYYNGHSYHDALKPKDPFWMYEL